MSVADMFRDFLGNLAITNGEAISNRYGEITAALNKKFRDTESKSDNSFQVGSFGRKTGIDGISDLDMLYIMPKGKWDTYKNGKQRKLLEDTKDAIKARYPKTEVRVDRVVVTVTYTDFHVEVQPVFEQDAQSYKFPDTKGAGSWSITKPREEMDELSAADVRKNANLKRLCKMGRAWRNKHGQEMGGLLIDTLAYNFLNSITNYDSASYASYDLLSRDFFKFLADEPNQSGYAAPGSRQRVKVKKKFQRKAKKAYDLCLDAIAAEGQANVNDKWKKVYGRPFPAAQEATVEVSAARASTTWRDTEEIIEDLYPIDIRYSLKLECRVEQRGFRTRYLREMLSRRFPLLAGNSLMFWVDEINVPQPFQLKWKVLNRGEAARKKDCIRGNIVHDEGHMRKSERTNFRGEHIVECYAIKDDVVVAKDRIPVPIQE